MKKVIQLILFSFLIIISIIFYKIYFVAKEQPKVEIDIQEEQQVPNTENNLIKNLKYEVKLDQDNQYIITSDLSEITYENNFEVVKMQNVTAIFIDQSNIPIIVTSDNAIYNNSNYNTKFYDNVRIEYLNNFINKMKQSGCKTVILHARKALLKGLTPKQNLNIPKLNYEMVYEIKKANPELEIIINGGISQTEEIKKHLEYCDGVMIGRAIYQNPYFLTDIEKEIFNTNEVPSREQIAKQIISYLEEEVKLGTKVNHVMRHTVGLYHGQPGSKDWKRYLSDNMMARDSDFQKAKHIMTIVQNNEKANQLNS